MLEKLNKMAPYLAAALLGYLAWGADESGPARANAEKGPPLITREMLRPTLLTGALPGARDPFEVAWSSYLTRAMSVESTPKRSLTASTLPAESLPRVATTAPASQPASAPATAPASQPASAPAAPPPLPLSAVTGVCLGEGIAFIVVGDMIYKSGDLLGGSDENRCWVIESIEADGATLRFGTIRRKLAMPAPKDPGAGSTPPKHSSVEKNS